MNLDELKLIVDLIGNLGAQGKEAFLWWLIFDTVPSFLIWTGFLALLFFIVFTVRRLNTDEAFYIECRDMLNLGSGYLSQDEVKQVKRKVLVLIEASKK